MKKWSWFLTGLLVMVGLVVIAFINRSESSISIEDIKENKNIKEFVTYEDYTVYIEKINNAKSRLKVHDGNLNNDKEIEGIKGDLHDITWSNNGKYFIVNEGDGIVATTYIVSIDDVDNFHKIKTVGNTIWSPDSEKLLIGVENNKKRTIDEELSGTIDLAIYYIASQVGETILEADELRDYYPKSWDQDNNIGYIEVKDGKEEDLTIKYEVSNEELAMGIIYSQDQPKDLSGLITLLSDIDFHRLERIYGEESVLNLLEWLSEEEVKGEDQVVILLGLLDEFLGEENYKYIETLANSYLGDKITFIKALAKVPTKVEEVAYALNNLNIYHGSEEEISKDLKMIVGSDKLNKVEKQVGINLLNIYDACGT